jgi:excisionase family DNA binding protein
MEQFVSPAEAAFALGISRTTLVRMIHDGTLPAVQLGPRLLRIPRASIDKLLQRSAVVAGVGQDGAA